MSTMLHGGSSCALDSSHIAGMTSAKIQGALVVICQQDIGRVCSHEVCSHQVWGHLHGIEAWKVDEN